jgi:hypothetical protein
MRCKTCGRKLPDTSPAMCVFCNKLWYMGSQPPDSANLSLEFRFNALQRQVARLLQLLKAEREGGKDILPELQDRV